MQTTVIGSSPSPAELARILERQKIEARAMRVLEQDDGMVALALALSLPGKNRDTKSGKKATKSRARAKAAKQSRKRNRRK